MRLEQEVKSIENQEGGFAEKKDDEKSLIVSLEEEIEKNPDNIQVKKDLLGIYFYHLYDEDGSSRNKGKKIILSLIDKFPEVLFPWGMVGPFFYNVNPKEVDLVELWNKKIDEKKSDPQVIRNAANFFTNINVEFSASLWKRLIDADHYDVGAMEKRARALSWIGLKDPIKKKENLKESFQIYKERLSMDWSAEEYQAFLNIREKYGSFLYSSYAMKWLFWISKGYCRCEGPLKDYYLIAEISEVGLNAGEMEAVRPLISQLEELLMKAEPENKWKPFLHTSYVVMARWAVYIKDRSKFESYLNKLALFPTENNQFFILQEIELVSDMMGSEFKDETRPYLLKRLNAFPPEEIAEVRKTIETAVKFKL